MTILPKYMKEENRILTLSAFKFKYESIADGTIRFPHPGGNAITYYNVMFYEDFGKIKKGQIFSDCHINLIHNFIHVSNHALDESGSKLLKNENDQYYLIDEIVQPFQCTPA